MCSVGSVGNSSDDCLFQTTQFKCQHIKKGETNERKRKGKMEREKPTADGDALTKR